MQHMTLWGHAVLGLEIIVAVWLSHRKLVGKLKKVTLEFNGNGKSETHEEKSKTL